MDIVEIYVSTLQNQEWVRCPDQGARVLAGHQISHLTRGGGQLYYIDWTLGKLQWFGPICHDWRLAPQTTISWMSCPTTTLGWGLQCVILVTTSDLGRLFCNQYIETAAKSRTEHWASIGIVSQIGTCWEISLINGMVINTKKMYFENDLILLDSVHDRSISKCFTRSIHIRWRQYKTRWIYIFCAYYNKCLDFKMAKK